MEDSDLMQPGWRDATRAVNGVALHVVEAGEPGRPLLILLHGFPEFWWAWRSASTWWGTIGARSSPGWVAARHPERLERVVVMDGPHPDAWSRQALRHPTQALRSTCAAFFQLRRVPEAVLGGLGCAGPKAMMRASAQAGTVEPVALERHVEAWSRPGALTAMLDYHTARCAGVRPAARRGGSRRRR